MEKEKKIKIFIIAIIIIAVLGIIIVKVATGKKQKGNSVGETTNQQHELDLKVKPDNEPNENLIKALENITNRNKEDKDTV